MKHFVRVTGVENALKVIFDFCDDYKTIKSEMKTKFIQFGKSSSREEKLKRLAKKYIDKDIEDTEDTSNEDDSEFLEYIKEVQLKLSDPYSLFKDSIPKNNLYEYLEKIDSFIPFSQGNINI